MPTYGLEHMENPHGNAARAKDTLSGGLLGSVAGAGAERLIRGSGKTRGVGAALGGLAGAAAGALNASAKNEKARVEAHNRELAHRIRKRSDERTSDRHMVRHTMLRHALNRAEKSDPEYSAHLDKVRERINSGSRKVLEAEKRAFFGEIREYLDSRNRKPLVGPTTYAADGINYEKMTPPKWKRLLKDTPAAVLGMGLGYGVGKTTTELGQRYLERYPTGRMAKATPLIAAGLGMAAGIAQDRARTELFNRRQDAQIEHDKHIGATSPQRFMDPVPKKGPNPVMIPRTGPPQYGTPKKGPNPHLLRAKLAAMQIGRVPKPKKDAPWRAADHEEWWGDLD